MTAVVWPSGPVAVSVPATSANVGPGYDFLGLALELRDRYRVHVLGHHATEPRVQVTSTGNGPDTPVPTDATNLVAATMIQGLRHWCGAVPAEIQLHCFNDIPHGRGLGSSSAAIVGGLGLARALTPEHCRPDLDAVLALAAEIEGHPDNVAPCLLGGFTPTWMGPDMARALWLQPHPRINPIVVIPEFTLATAKARGAMPEQVPLADAVFNASRATILGYAMTMAPELIFDATADRLHQQRRGDMYPRSLELVRQLRDLGLAAVISGAGPSVLVLAVDDVRTVADQVRGIVDAQWRVLTPGFALHGLVDVDPADVL